MSNRDVALRYVRAFCSGDVAGVEASLADEFSLEGPLFAFASRDGYIEALRSEPLERGDCRPIAILEAEDAAAVAVFYSYEKASGPVTIGQLFWFDDGRITRTLIVFDSAASRPQEGDRE